MASWKAALAAVLVLAPVGLPATAADIDSSLGWMQLKPLLFGDREVHAHAKQVVELFVPQRADNAAVVPVMVRTHIEQTPERYIEHLYLIIDENPSPFGVKFTLTPRSGRADIETRVRMESSSPIRIVAEMNDGSLWMDSSMVYGAGGCSAPVSSGTSAQTLGRMKLRVETALSEPGEPVLAQLMVQHPQYSGMATNVKLEPHFVRRVDVYYAEHLVMSADVDFTISENPSFRFYFLPAGDGELRAEVVDSTQLRFEQSLTVSAPK